MKTYNIGTFVGLLEMIGEKPGFFLAGPLPARNSQSLQALYNFIIGFQTAAICRDSTSVLKEFTPWVCHHYGILDGSMKWYHHLLERAAGDDEKAFNLFFELLADYLRERERLGPKAIEQRFVAMAERKMKKHRRPC